jgi:mannose-6-phosphate isomerase-like protein (cupin superfamily)
MTNRFLLVLGGVFVVSAFIHAAVRAQDKPGGYIVQQDAQVAQQQPGPHKGGGQTVGHSFFSDVPNLSLVFRKRVLTPGSSIGYHKQQEDEIYYILSGRGTMRLDGKDVAVGPGTAVLTRTGSSHGLTPAGSEDLVLIINYLQEPKK